MKMNIVRFINLCLMASCLFLCLKECQSQLTFTPSWGGKRSTPNQAPQGLFSSSDSSLNSAPQPGMGCNPKMDSMLLIYRLIQNEAKNVLECSNNQK